MILRGRPESVKRIDGANDDCVAGTQDGKLLTAGTGQLLPMYDANGHNGATPQIENDLLFRIKYTDPAP